MKFSPLNKKMSKAENINQVSAGINFYSHSSKVRNDPDYTQFIIQTIKGTMLYQEEYSSMEETKGSKQQTSLCQIFSPFFLVAKIHLSRRVIQLIYFFPVFFSEVCKMINMPRVHTSIQYALFCKKQNKQLFFIEVVLILVQLTCVMCMRQQN